MSFELLGVVFGYFGVLCVFELPGFWGVLRVCVDGFVFWLHWFGGFSFPGFGVWFFLGGFEGFHLTVGFVI